MRLVIGQSRAVTRRETFAWLWSPMTRLRQWSGADLGATPSERLRTHVDLIRPVDRRAGSLISL